MLYSTGQKRKAQAENAAQLDTGFARKRIRTSERSGDVSEEESDDSDIDEYLPGTAGATKSVRSTFAQRGKKEHKPVHKSRSAKASKMSVDEQKASNSSNPVASLKGAHGRPLSREQIRKANHSLIERRRREKMNKAFADLRSMVPGLSGESEGIKGEFKLEVLERSVEHMRYLAQRLAVLESKRSTSTMFRSVHDQEVVTNLPTSSRARSVASEFRSPSISGTKRKVDSYVEDADDVQHSRDSRHSSVQRPLVNQRSPADGELEFQHYQSGGTAHSRGESTASPSYRIIERERSSGFLTPLLPASRSLTGPSTSTINSLLSSPAGSSTRSANATARDVTRSPFTRADSQATIPEDVLPAHGSVHPSLRSTHPGGLVNAVDDIRHPQPENPASAFDGLPSAFFRLAHLRVEQNSRMQEHTSLTGLQEESGSSMARYRNPNLTLPPPVSMDSPTSPFFRPALDFDNTGDVHSAGRSTPVEPSPFLPPIIGSSVLFENALPQLQERHLSRTSVTSVTSDYNSLGKEEEAAANVLLQLSSPEVMTPWQPASNPAQSLASLERWSLDQSSMASGHSQPSQEKACSRSRSEPSAQDEMTAERETSNVRAPSTSASCPIPSSEAPAGITTIQVASTSRIRKTAMDFLDMNRDMPGPLVSRFS